MRGTLVETLIGAVVLLVAAWFVYFAYSHTELGPVGGYHLSARFDKVGDLANGADVKISGIKIGTVTTQTLDPKTYEAVVELGIQSDVELPDDTTAKIASAGLLGGSYISLEPGGSEDLLEDGDRIGYTQGAVDLMGLLGRFIYGSTDSGKEAAKPDAPAPAVEAGQ